MKCAMTRSGVRVVLLVAALLGGSAAPAVAQSQKAEAEKFFRAGEQAYNAGQYLVAAQAFEEAYRLLPVPAIAFSTAQAYRLQYFIDKDPGWLKRSIELYRLYVSQVESGGRRDDAVASLAEIEPIMLRIEAEQRGPIETRVAAAATQLMVSTQVQGARVSIDGNSGEAPFLRKVDPGPHKIEVTADGYFPVEQTATAVEGKFVPIEVTLQPRPARVKIRTESGARVVIDGRPAGTAPISRPVELPAGKHFVSVSRRGRYGWSREIVVERGEEVELSAPLHKTTQRKISHWVLGASALALGVAGLTSLQALRADNRADDLNQRRLDDTTIFTRADQAQYEDEIVLRDARLRDTYIWLGIAGAIGAAGALMVLLDSPRAEMPPLAAGKPGEAPAQPTLGVGPLLGPELAGLSLVGRF